VHVFDHERQVVFDFIGAVRYLFWLGKPAVVRNQEIDAIKHWLSNDNVETFSLTPLAPGDKVSVKNDLLGNREAIVQQVGKSRVKFIIEGLRGVLNMKIKHVV